MAVEQDFCIQAGDPLDAFLYQFWIALQEVCPTDALIEDKITGEEDFSFGPMNRKRARGMTRGLVDMKGLPTPMEFPFLQVKVNSGTPP